MPVAATNSLQSQYRASAVKIVPWEAADITVGTEQEPEPIAVATGSAEVKDMQIAEGLIITGTILALPLLIKAFFDNAGVAVALSDLKLWSLPTALWVVLVGWWRYRRLDARLKKAAAAAKARSP